MRRRWLRRIRRAWDRWTARARWRLGLRDHALHREADEGTQMLNIARRRYGRSIYLLPKERRARRKA